MSSLIIRDLAVNEMQEAFEWYENQQFGLGFNLLDHAGICLKSIEKNPAYYGFLTKFERRIHLRKFPYKIIYFLSEDNIVVSSFFHAARKPRP